MANLDHGILNVPLSKRGNIDAEIDRHKADQAAEKKAAAKVRHAETLDRRATAKRMFAETTEERFAELAAHCKVSVSALKKTLRSDCHWQPSLVIRVLEHRRCGTCADWDRSTGNCWSAERSDGHAIGEPADHTGPEETCEAWQPTVAA